MPSSLRWTVRFALALAVMSYGCSDETSLPSAPEAGRSADRAPLLGSAAVGQSVAGSYIVVFHDDVADAGAVVDEAEAAHGFKADHRYSHALKGFAARLPEPALNSLRNNPRVAYIEPDQVAHIVSTQANPPWGLDRIDQRSRPLDGSFGYDQTGAGVDVYCLDTGIRLTHSDFGGRAVTGYDAITPGGPATDGHGHGTHTAGTIGGSVYGVAKRTRLFAVRVLDNNGSGSYSQVIAGIDWVTAHHSTGPAVANMSLGGPASAAIDQAVRNSIADGVTYCISAGNSSVDASTFSPARVGEAVTVGATDASDAMASFSNYGTLVDIQAPGVGVASAYHISDTAVATMSGTSMSAPHVAGAVALYLEANPAATPSEVHAAMTDNATPDQVTSLPVGTPNRLLYSVVTIAPPAVEPVPAAPALLSPNNGAGAVSKNPTLAWNASAGAASYRVQVSTNQAFTEVVRDQSGLTTTSTALVGLGSRTVHYWRVNAANANGTSEWSEVWSFRTRK